PGGGELPGGGEMPQGGGTAPGGTAEAGGTPPSGADGQAGGRADGTAMGGGMGGNASTELIAYLKKHQDGATWLLAVSSSQSAAQLILSSGEPIISMWGWSGSDQAMTLAKLKELVESGQLHYVQISGGGMGGGMGGDSSLSTEVTEWVQKNGTEVTAVDGASGVYRLDASDLT
ncbi:hypothetical protein NGM37_30675, partial [Streptomyces sp. TRM76130]|nr:hypothetical protein [Streptomyces sp. TRM76130]